MSINTLGEFRQSISRSMIVSFLVIALLSFFVLFVTHQNYEKWMRQGDRQQIKNAIAIYQSNLSEKLSIVANSTTFVDFLRSGKETRKSLLPDLRYELSNVDFTNTAGMVVSNRSNDILFQQGSKSDYPVTLLLCYLNRTLHEMGECNYNWTLFLSKDSIIQQLQRINSRIEECQSCGSVNFLKDKNFGSFVVQNSFPFELNIKIKRQDQYILYFYALFILGVLIIFTIWNRYRIKYIVNRYIANPIENITSVLFSGKIIDEKDKYINEISYLLERLQFWQIETQKAEGQKHEAAIGRLTSQVVHDIRSPLTALDIAIKSTASMPEAERMLIRNAALRINDIANNLLTQYRQKNLEMDQHPALKPELISDICLNVISEKRIQMKSAAVELVVTIDDNTHGSFANIVSSELQRALSNLIENAASVIVSAVA